MRTHNQIKTTIFAFIIGFAVGAIYLYFYVNGYFGKAIFGWDVLGLFVLDFLHPLSLLFYILAAVIVYAIWKRPLHIENLNLKSFKTFSIVFLFLISTIMLYLVFNDRELAKILGFFYFLLVGFTISYYFGSKLFELNNTQNLKFK